MIHRDAGTIQVGANYGGGTAPALLAVTLRRSLLSTSGDCLELSLDFDNLAPNKRL